MSHGELGDLNLTSYSAANKSWGKVWVEENNEICLSFHGTIPDLHCDQKPKIKINNNSLKYWQTEFVK